MIADNVLFVNRKPKLQREIEQDLENDELSFEEAAFLMGYNDFN